MTINIPPEHFEDEIDCHMTDGIVCPYCGHDQRNIWDDGGYREDELNDYTCGECNKEFKVQLHVIYYFTSHKEDIDND